MSSTSRGVLSLSQFLLRSKSLNLYRDILRTIKKVPNKEHQIELKRWVREDFEQNKHTRDEKKGCYGTWRSHGLTQKDLGFYG